MPFFPSCFLSICFSLVRANFVPHGRLEKPAGTACCHLTMRVRNAGRRRFTCTRGRGSRNVGRRRALHRRRTTSLRAAPRRRFGLRWRGRLDATSREYLTPSPRHQPRPHGPPPSVRTLLPPRHPPPGARARSHFRADNRAVSLPSRRVLDPSLFATSFGVCPRCSFLSPFSFSRSRRLFCSLSLCLSLPSRDLSLSPSHCTVLRRVFGTFLPLFFHRLLYLFLLFFLRHQPVPSLSLFLFVLSPVATPGVSRRLDAALR